MKWSLVQEGTPELFLAVGVMIDRSFGKYMLKAMHYSET